jgi:hypothetical protein
MVSTAQFSVKSTVEVASWTTSPFGAFAQYCKLCPAAQDAMIAAYRLATYRLAKPRAHHSIAVPLCLCAPCALKLAAQQRPPTKRGTTCAAATNTYNNLSSTAVPRYADNEARNRVPTKQMATDRLTRATRVPFKSLAKRDARIGRAGRGGRCRAWRKCDKRVPPPSAPRQKAFRRFGGWTNQPQPCSQSRVHGR